MIAPARRQYLDIKAQHSDAILLYQVGDFYETFDDDARIAAHELQIALTGRSYGPGERVPLAGVPVHALENYAAKLLARGYKVAICEQIEVPNKGLAKREVTRILTPGTIVSPGMVPPSRDNYLVAIATAQTAGSSRGRGGGGTGLAYIDASTGTFCCTEWPAGQSPDSVRAELERLAPAEIIMADQLAASSNAGVELLGQPANYPITNCPDHFFYLEESRGRLCRHFQTPTLAAFVPPAHTLAIAACGAILAYVERMNPALLLLVNGLSYYETGDLVQIDGHTWQALEAVAPAHASSLYGGGPTTRAWRATKGEPQPTTLLSLLDCTRTLMGSRMLRRTLLSPLCDRSILEERLDATQEIYADIDLRQRLAAILDGLPDLERLSARVVQGSAAPRELHAIRLGLKQSAELARALRSAQTPALQLATKSIDTCPEVSRLIEEAVADSAGQVIQPGYSSELDDVVASIAEARGWIAGLEAIERERTGIKSLKVGYNKVFGYYLEVSHANLSRVPPEYQRRQTLVNGERYITAELKEREAAILHAEEQISEIESRLYRGVLESIAAQHLRLRSTALAVASVDVRLALAQVALTRGYVRPELSDATELHIQAGRHPIVEASLDADEFIANDTHLEPLVDGDQGTRIMLLTGPNMAGKSTYLRQVAAIVLLAQIGSFVPARSARIGLVDRISCRVGAEDDLARGMSTFMLEMVETASILRQSTARSLVILDEVGRGTSTHDGLAIARAVTEHLHDALGARTLFATHYHELAVLEESLAHLATFQMEVAEKDGEPVFLHRVVPGASSQSYGVEVARMAGLPISVTRRAAEVLVESLTTMHQTAERTSLANRPHRHQHYESRMPAAELAEAIGSPYSVPLDPARAVAVALASLNIAAMTPVDALNILFSLQQQSLAILQMDG
ncbi:MAG: DNA mismatch repair protein MutS [Ktedonobacterales bacterium]